MLTNTSITGIDPFSPLSSFTANTIKIPRGIFYGGIFYTSQPYLAPCHISYIQGPSDGWLGVWGVADQDGQKLGVIKFTDTPRLMGNIFTTAGDYAGCLAGRPVNFNAIAVEFTRSGNTITNVDESTVQDLGVFLKSIHGTHILNTDSLVFDVCNCYTIGAGNNYSNYPRVIQLPEDCQLLPDADGRYYAAPYSSGGTVETKPIVKKITFISSGGTASISGKHVCISPMWISDYNYDSTTNMITPTSGGFIGVADVVVVEHDNAVIISDHKTFGALE